MMERNALKDAKTYANEVMMYMVQARSLSSQVQDIGQLRAAQQYVPPFCNQSSSQLIFIEQRLGYGRSI
jgi:hypothetical protein